MEGREKKEIKIEEKNGVTVISCSGPVDSDGFPDIKNSIESLLSGGSWKIVIDMTNINFITSAGWGAFLGNVRKARDNSGDIRLAGMKKNVKKTFTLMELEEILKTYSTADEAIESFN